MRRNKEKAFQNNGFSVRSSFALSAHFRVWVTVWVSTAGSAGVGQLAMV